MKKMPSFLKPLAVLGLAATVSGCAGLNIGKSEFSCEGIGEDEKCQSTRQIYEATHQGKLPTPPGEEDKGSDAEQRVAESQQGGADPNDVVSNYVTPRLPNQPVPIRTPAEVMRVWIAPWEDKRGDLVVSGYLYTEIESRRWVVGDTVSARSNATLRPLQRPQQQAAAEAEPQD